MNRKVTVVGGAGNVGATVARCIADKQLADVVIVDLEHHTFGLEIRRVGQELGDGISFVLSFVR